MLTDITRSNRALSTCIFIAGCWLSAGCGVDVDLSESTVDQSISGDFVDSSGTVTVRIKECPPTGFGEHLTATCTVDSNFVLIGGGADVVGEGNPGALLTASYPDSSLTTWIASSKDHGLVFYHQLRTYAIGLQLAGVSATTLRNYMYFTSGSSPFASERPSSTAQLPPGYKLLGGGAIANYTGPGLLLTSSRPDGFQWVAEAKDHKYGESGTVTTYAIGITSGTIPGFGSLDTLSTSAPTWAPTGYGTASIATPSGWVLASVGANAQYNGAGRLLTDMIPFVDAPSNSSMGAMIRSKDHILADSGYTTAYLIAIRKQ
jgi:hypothetical protein